MNFVSLSLGGVEVGTVSEALARAIQELVVLHDLSGTRAQVLVVARDDQDEEHVRLIGSHQGREAYTACADAFALADTHQGERIPMRLPRSVELSHCDHTHH